MRISLTSRFHIRSRVPLGDVLANPFALALAFPAHRASPLMKAFQLNEVGTEKVRIGNRAKAHVRR